MPDFPADAASIGPAGALSPWAEGSVYNGLYGGGWASRTLVANLAVIAEVFLPVIATLRGFSWTNGSAVSGNVDCGLYDAHRNQIAHTGSTAQAGTNASQAVGATATQLNPGNYYVAVAIDNATGTFNSQGSNPNSAGTFYIYPAFGLFTMASAFPLPSTLTLAAPSAAAQAYLPMFGALIDTSVV